MPYDLTRLQRDIAQIQHDDAGFGTGRLVAENLILTAAHTINKIDGTGPVLKGWQVRLARDRGLGPWRFRRGNVVIWHDLARDLALIRLINSEGDSLRPELRLRIATILGNNPHPVEARGYPRASKQVGLGPRDLTPVLGRLTAADPDRPLRFGVDHSDLPNEPHADWPGMSGSAVLLQDWPDHDEIWIYGVVREVPANFEGQLRVARLADAWQRDTKFRKLLVAAGVPDADVEDPTGVSSETRNRSVPLIRDSNKNIDPTNLDHGSKPGERTGGDVQCSIDFASVVEPDDVSIELMFQVFFKLAAKIVEVTSNTIALPREIYKWANWPRFRDEIKGAAFVINWDPVISKLVGTVEELLQQAKAYRNENSAFYGRHPSDVAMVIRQLDIALRLSAQLMKNLPRRLPWLWLSLLDYCGPYPSNSSSLYHVQRNYLRFSSLRLYHALASTIRYTEVNTPILSSLDEKLFSGSRWEHNMVVFFDKTGDNNNEIDEVVVAYINRIAGVNWPEVCIYGPRDLTAWAYGQSVFSDRLGRRVITSPWFMRYLVPQVELLMAESSPDKETSYREEAWFQKVRTLSGDEIEPTRRED